MKNFLFLSIGGFLGTFFRYTLTELINKYSTFNFAIGTILVNILGCFLIGLFSEISHLNQHLRLLLITGFCGAFTTFSTFIFETNHLFKNYNLLIALANIVLSVVFGYLFFRLGSGLYLKIF
jgi:CrcB protein